MGDRYENQRSYSSNNYTKKTYGSGYRGKRGTNYNSNKRYTERDGGVSQGFSQNTNSESKSYEDNSYNKVSVLIELYLYLFYQFFSYS